MGTGHTRTRAPIRNDRASEMEEIKGREDPLSERGRCRRPERRIEPADAAKQPVRGNRREAAIAPHTVSLIGARSGAERSSMSTATVAAGDVDDAHRSENAERNDHRAENGGEAHGFISFFCRFPARTLSGGGS